VRHVLLQPLVYTLVLWLHWGEIPGIVGCWGRLTPSGSGQWRVSWADGCEDLGSQLKTDMKVSLQLALNNIQLDLNEREREGHWDRSGEPSRHDMG
jgi:hypothetical protein